MRAFMNSVVYNAAGNGVTLTKCPARRAGCKKQPHVDDHLLQARVQMRHQLRRPDRVAFEVRGLTSKRRTISRSLSKPNSAGWGEGASLITAFFRRAGFEKSRVAGIGIVEFGQGNAITGRIVDDAVHECPHQ